MTALVAAVAALLNDSGVAVYSPDAVLPEGSVSLGIGSFPAADKAVALTTYAGPEPDSRNGWEYPRLQVRVRAVNPLDALDLDRAAYDVLQAYAGSLPGGLWTVDDCHALQSDPAPLGIDANGRHEYARNYQLAASLAAG